MTTMEKIILVCFAVFAMVSAIPQKAYPGTGYVVTSAKYANGDTSCSNFATMQSLTYVPINTCIVAETAVAATTTGFSQGANLGQSYMYSVNTLPYASSNSVSNNSVVWISTWYGTACGTNSTQTIVDYRPLRTTCQCGSGSCQSTNYYVKNAPLPPATYSGNYITTTYYVNGVDVSGTSGSLAVTLTPVNSNQACYPQNNYNNVVTVPQTIPINLVTFTGPSPLTVKQPPPNTATTVVGGPVTAPYYQVCSYVQSVAGVLMTPTQGNYAQSSLGLVYNGYVLASLNQGVVNFGPNVCTSSSTLPTQLQQIPVGICTPVYAGYNFGNGVVGSSMYYTFNAGSIGSGAGAYAQAPIGKTGVYGVSNQYISGNYYTGSSCAGTPLIVYTWASNAALCQADVSGQPAVVAWSAMPYQLPSSLSGVIVNTYYSTVGTTSTASILSPTAGCNGNPVWVNYNFNTVQGQTTICSGTSGQYPLTYTSTCNSVFSNAYPGLNPPASTMGGFVKIEQFTDNACTAPKVGLVTPGYITSNSELPGLTYTQIGVCSLVAGSFINQMGTSIPLNAGQSQMVVQTATGVVFNTYYGSTCQGTPLRSVARANGFCSCISGLCMTTATATTSSVWQKITTQTTASITTPWGTTGGSLNGGGMLLGYTSKDSCTLGNSTVSLYSATPVTTGCLPYTVQNITQTTPALALPQYNLVPYQSPNFYYTQYINNCPMPLPTYSPTTAPPQAPPTRSPTNVLKNACFAGSELVTLESGDKQMSEVQMGDRILTVNNKGEQVFSDVVFVPHGANEERTTFTVVTTESGRDLKMTANHFLPAGACATPSTLSVIAASQVKVGDCVQTVSGREQVVSIKKVEGKGVYTVIAMEELIVVNGIVATPYGAVNPTLVNMYYNLHRLAYATFWQRSTGISASTTSLLQGTAEKVWGLLLTLSI